MNEPKDCREIGGHNPSVIISADTAYEALKAIRAQAAAGAYKHLYADDASFLRAAIRELEKASE